MCQKPFFSGSILYLLGLGRVQGGLTGFFIATQVLSIIVLKATHLDFITQHLSERKIRSFQANSSFCCTE